MTPSLGRPIATHRNGDSVRALFPFVQAGIGKTALNVTVTVREVRGAPEIVALTIEPLDDRCPVMQMLGLDVDPDPIITSEFLRRLPLRQLKEMCLASRRPQADTFAAFKGRRPTGRAPLSMELLERVAATYVQAQAGGKPPLKQVQITEIVERATASKYIRRAREAGLLGWPSRPGIAGTSESVSPFAATSSGGSRTTRKTQASSADKRDEPQRGDTP
jgi:hypothetical protein